MIFPVILSGGSGKRLWPLSRPLFPKQLQTITSKLTMIQQTAQRTADSNAGFASPLIICNQDHRFIVAAQMQDIGISPKIIILEPEGRSTAPAAALAALVLEDEPDALMLIMPSDHVIDRPDLLCEFVLRAAPVASRGYFITFGIVPDAPATGYGYIHRAAELQDGVFAVDRFIEKPDVATATTYLNSGEYLWNSGIFLMSAAAFLSELAQLDPDMLALCRASMSSGSRDMDFLRPAVEPFSQIVENSIDYVLMERTKQAGVVPVDIGWSDLGTWSSIWKHFDKDERGNVARGNVFALDSDNCYLHSEHKVLAAIGLRDMIVVDTGDAILVADRRRDQDVRQIVDRMRAEGRTEAETHVRTYRPWGWFETVSQGDRYHVKLIMVKPGGKLSSQMHWHRSEHWVIVSGVAEVWHADKSFVLHENQSTFIPAGAVHRVANPGKLPLYMIEVQSGAYLGEDDIVRFDDVYGRASDKPEYSKVNNPPPLDPIQVERKSRKEGQ